MRLATLTSTETRHLFFVNAIRSEFPVVAAGLEITGYSPTQSPVEHLTDDERAIVSHHFAERTRLEKQFFGENGCEPNDDDVISVRHIEVGDLNSVQTLEWLIDRGVDTVAVFGTNLIREPLISHWPGRMLNMHLGLSPYYRGTATNFYPLLNEEPEFVGATIHLIDAGIDSGPIVRHARPPIELGDRPHTIGCKAILAGIEAMKTSLRDLARNGAVKSVPQWKPENPRLYLRRDYDPRQVVELYQKLDRGLIERYLERERIGETSLRLIE